MDCLTKGTQAACDNIMTSCPLRTDTGFKLKKEGENFFLLAQFRTLYGRDGHLFIDNTCDMLSISRLLEMLSFPDYGTTVNEIIYKYSKYRNIQQYKLK